MGAVTLVILGLAAVAILAAVIAATIYNRLVTLRQRVLNAFAQIDVQLKRRHDLIPNLVEAVKGYMAHEKQTLERVIAARNAAKSRCGASASPMTMRGKHDAQSAITRTRRSAAARLI